MSKRTLALREVASRKDLKAFTFLPEQIHAGRRNWVPPLYSHDLKHFDPRKNPASGHCESVRFLACRGHEVVGRVLGIVNSRHNQLLGSRTARFAFLETYEDRDVVRLLLDGVERWARGLGMDRVIGPYGFSDLDPEGFLVEGFEHRATLGTLHNFEWMPTFVEACGYSKEVDYVTYHIEITHIPALFREVHDRVLSRGHVEVLELRNRAQLWKWAKPIVELMNECYFRGGMFGFSPLDARQVSRLMGDFVLFLEPGLVKLVRCGDELAAFVIGIPDMTEGIQRARGRLLPLGFLEVLRARRNSRQLDLVLGCVKERFRRQGLDAVLAYRMCLTAMPRGMSLVDTHHVMESNLAMRNLYQRVGGKIRKRFRVFGKDIGASA